MKKIKIIIGTTAVGKTNWAVEYALKNDAQIISADSMQIYKYMDIGTAKPRPEETRGIAHYLIDIVYPDELFSVYNFTHQANAWIDNIRQKEKEPIIVGGSGLYINAFIRGFLFPSVPRDPEIRKKLKAASRETGTKQLYEKLLSIDKHSAEKISPNDTYRIIRALEVYYITDKPLSEFHQSKKEYRQDIDIYWLHRDRQEIYNRIETRVDSMIKKGLFDEVQALQALGYSSGIPSLQALGYKESIDYLKGKTNKEDCIALIKKRTRHLAKRQLTWFRNFPVSRNLYLE